MHGTAAQRMRRHGCQRPWAGAQIVAVIVVLLSTAVFYLFGARELPSDLQRVVLLLASAQLVMVVLLFVSISLLDPAHPAVIERRSERCASASTSSSASQSPEEFVVRAASEHGGSLACAGAQTPPPPSVSASTTTHRRLRCALCDVAVSLGTRHCSVCHKCVVGFDHHCAYLNTCIGSRNYPLFIALLSCTILLLSTQLAVACYAIDRMRRRKETLCAVAVSLFIIAPLLQVISMLVLALFHSYLFCKGLKTYEWLRRFHEKRSVKFTAKTPTWKRHDDQERQDNVSDDRRNNTAPSSIAIEIRADVV